MKKIITNSSSYYTDPILFEEGFFKDKKAESRFLKKLEETTPESKNVKVIPTKSIR